MLAAGNHTNDRGLLIGETWTRQLLGAVGTIIPCFIADYM